ncbi:MAG TPA: chorismate synthase [Dissulfurispiraceae bacterium]|nr:chorismate synthase [Dissulfurispiraceae bacterium]
MNKLRFFTAGESHGPALIGLLDGIPAGLPLAQDDIDKELRRRQGGYGRGGRMKIEQDSATILSGVRWGKTLGSPITLQIMNRDYQNWIAGMSADAGHEGAIAAVTRPRPGHADLAGALKYAHTDVRNILERSSARETAARVALGAVAKRVLAEFSVSIGSYVTRIGSAAMPPCDGLDISHDFFATVEASPVRCPDPKTAQKMMKVIDTAMRKGDSVGGTFSVIASGLPAGLGSHVQWDAKLDARLAYAVMSIQAIKGVEIGLGFGAAEQFGSEVMDEILPRRKGAKAASLHGSCKYIRETNRAGGIEGGMTNGMPVVMNAAMKPIPTLRKPLRSVDLRTGKPIEAAYERSDTCAVPAAAVVGEAMVALVLADAMLEKFGGDSLAETRRNFDSYLAQTQAR